MRLQKFRALPDGLFMRENFSDIFQRNAGRRQKHMVDLQFDASHNIAGVTLHQVVNLIDRAVRAVFNRQYAIRAKPLLNRLENAFKIPEIQDVGRRKELVAGLL